MAPIPTIARAAPAAAGRGARQGVDVVGRGRHAFPGCVVSACCSACHRPYEFQSPCCRVFPGPWLHNGGGVVTGGFFCWISMTYAAMFQRSSGLTRSA